MSECIDAALLRSRPTPHLGEGSDKDARGRVLIVGGGADVPGAVILAGISALRAGAGKLQVAATPDFAVSLGIALPEARVISVPATKTGELAVEAADVLSSHVDRCQAVVVGPGMMDEGAAQLLTTRLLGRGGHAAFVLDAAAMTGLRSGVARKLGGRLVITPHAGEMAALSGKSKDKVLADPLTAAREIAASLQAVVVMKGKDTHVVSPDGRAWTHEGGVIGLATSGSGDVLAGVIGGLLARGFAPTDAAIRGVYLHGQAGLRLSQEIGPLGFLARELPSQIPQAMALLDA